MQRLRVALLAFVACAAISGEAREYEPAYVKLAPVQASAHTYYVQGDAGPASPANEGYNSNAGFVVTPEGVVVVDALGTPSLGNELIKAIRTVTAAPIKRVIVTHYHADHVYGLQAFKAIGAEIWAHHDGREYIENEAPARLAQRRHDLAPWVNDETRVLMPDRWLGENETFELGGMRFEVIHMGPAHSPEDVVIVVPAERVLFSGDILFAGRIPFVGEADSKRWLATIERLLALQPRIMITGHGKMSIDPARDLTLTRDYLMYLRMAMGKAVEDFTPFDEAYKNTDWKRFAHLPAFDAANRINAYGTYLLMEKELLQQR
jgi:glyoxylase-like metal-dependent hydrolase (beta-lactamase superfamily II)